MISKLRPFDRVFLGIISVIAIFGLLMVYEASVVYASETFGGKYHFLILQFGWMTIGFIGMFFLSRIDLMLIKKYTPYAKLNGSGDRKELLKNCSDYKIGSAFNNIYYSALNKIEKYGWGK